MVKKLIKVAVVRPHRGVATENANKDVDNSGFLWGLLGCCIPLVGLILFLVWKDNKPKTAKAAGIGALVSVGCIVLFYVLIFAIGTFGASLNSGY